MRGRRSRPLWIVATAAVLALSGCASSRGILAYTPHESQNVGTGAEVRIATVTDARKFELSPSDPSIPSLKGGEIGDPAITSRAIARKRNGYGRAMGDILLPEGQSVTGLVSAAVARGLREGGYRVLAPGDPGYDAAAPIDVRIDQFWMWLSPGFWAVHLEFRSSIDLKGPIPSLENGATIPGYVRLASQAAATRAWTNTLDKGLENFHSNLVKHLRGGSAESGTGSGAPESRR